MNTITRVEDEDLQRRRRRNNTDVVADGEVWSVPMFMMDSVQRAVAAAAHPALHAPGHARFSDDQNARRSLAYSAYERQLTDSWKSPAPLAVPAAQAAPVAPAAPAVPVATHYEKYDAWLRDAWRGPNKENSHD